MISAHERELLDAARAGDEHAFARLVEPYRAELDVHCRRMLGSAHDAEDAVQEALLRAWRGLDGFQTRSALRAWLYRIATNCALSMLQRRGSRAVPIAPDVAQDGQDAPVAPGSTLPDLRWEQREGLELALLAAHEHLPARQRAVLILREALGFSAGEVAASLETTTASVNSALQRARATVAARRPERTGQIALDALRDDGLRESVRRCADAWASADVDGVVALLAAEARC